MIPWRLHYSGIRDFAPTMIDMAGNDSHIMITGPNGAGKSTISFCMGAVLYSSKVDVEGLKSRNLPPDRTWKSIISLLFKNDGLMKIDAPTYIEFSLKIEQEPGQPIKQEFSIHSGEEVDEWIETITYRSGHRQYSFTNYKEDLQYKYKIDPDLFYLIWYQQEVNQFAVMNPKERFRIFSEMHGIDKAHKDWEASIEKAKETQEELQGAEINVKFKKSDLTFRQIALDRFLGNQKRLHEGAKMYIESLVKLEAYYKNEIKIQERLLIDLDSSRLDKVDELAVKQGELKKKEIELKGYKTDYELSDKELGEKQEELEGIKEKVSQLDVEINQLKEELDLIIQRKSRIDRTEQEVRTELQQLLAKQNGTQQNIESLTIELFQLKEDWEKRKGTAIRLQLQIEEDARRGIQCKEILQEYKSSHAVTEKIQGFTDRDSVVKDVLFSKGKELREYEAELSMLTSNRNLSARQMESLAYLRNKQISAYALQELIELTDAAKLKEEQLFDAIKYTIFFNGKHITPPNDLYHVSLVETVPNRSITHLPDLHLQIKKGIDELMEPYAMKALWWIEKIVKEDSLFSLTHGVLTDPLGVRGLQEKERYILSEKSLLARKQVVEEQIAKLIQLLADNEQEHVENNNQIQVLNGIIYTVRDAEAFMTKEHERQLEKKKLSEEQTCIIEVEAQQIHLAIKKDEWLHLKIEQENAISKLREEEAIYTEFAKMKDQIERLSALKTERVGYQTAIQKLNTSIQESENILDQLEGYQRTIKRKMGQREDNIEDLGREIESIKKQLVNARSYKEVAQSEAIKMAGELTDLQKLVIDLYLEVVGTMNEDDSKSIPQLKIDYDNGKTMFQNARIESDIDPAAQENYDTVKSEYERMDDEYKRTVILLEENIDRAEKLKDRLQTTINMRVLEIEQRFKMYMSQFQFEGEISWHSYEDKRGRTHFDLYIKARKEGHRGAMEDVSIKARAGKVGKGVSGGEESLTSLLFALALLQNLQTSPGFIVLDEFDSALDEQRKLKVFDLYEQVLKRKLIILTPKSHEQAYVNRFNKAFVVQHDPSIPRSKVVGIVKT
ncbi:AAA family ATPase [Sporosarcina sp. FSL K6-6792]|uniref:AAA family ATPase n=1 Tax=Sporosarcina sp. FSL K6-6792 TaxID=2921559 RepID=UPI0030F65530